MKTEIISEGSRKKHDTHEKNVPGEKLIRNNHFLFYLLYLGQLFHDGILFGKVFSRRTTNCLLGGFFLWLSVCRYPSEGSNHGSYKLKLKFKNIQEHFSGNRTFQ